MAGAPQGDKQTMDFLYLRARTVRYIHLPGNLDPAAAIVAHRRAAAEALAAHRRHDHPVCILQIQIKYVVLSASSSSCAA